MRIKIASRKSDLARLQSYTVADKIKEKFPEINIEFDFSSSFGDQNPDAPLWEMPAKGVFTEDFRDGLANEEFDMVVHSWKDLPSDNLTTSKIHTLERADARDLLLIRKDKLIEVEKSKEISILTSSPRREYHLNKSLKELLPHGISNLNFLTVRGNIATRIKKLIGGEADALVVAKAAIDRLLSAPQEEYIDSKKELRQYLDQCHWIVLPLSLFPTAAAQGAIAIETKQSNNKINEILTSICDSATYENVVKEREILTSYGGGCHQKIGISFTQYSFGVVKSLLGKTEDGKEIRDYSLINSLNSSNQNFWPSNKTSKLFFSKDLFKITIPNRPLWISHESSLPLQWKQVDTKPIWCAGVKTWKKLAQRGIWINGCCDGLGETIDQKLEQMQDSKINWLKLNHDLGANNNGFETLATYKLIPNTEIPNLSNIEEFYWMSGSQFLLAIQKYPEIINKQHFCGPGNTYETLKKHIKEVQINISLSFEHWLSDREKLG